MVWFPPLKNPRGTEECLEEMNASFGTWMPAVWWLSSIHGGNFPASYIGVTGGYLNSLKRNEMMRESWGGMKFLCQKIRRLPGLSTSSLITSDDLETLIHWYIFFLWKVFVDHVIGSTKSRCSPTPMGRRDEDVVLLHSRNFLTWKPSKKLIVL